MVKPESVDELHRLGGFVKEQHEGRKDLPVTGTDFYNFAVLLDSNFATMSSEFKAVRVEMKEGFSEIRSEMAQMPMKIAAWFATTLIGLIGVVCAVVAVVIAVV